MTPNALADLLEHDLHTTRPRMTTEVLLQDAIAAALVRAGLAVEREARLSTRDRVDFLVDGVGLEVKIKGGLSALTRQLFRYAEHDRVQGLLVVSTRNLHRGAPTEVLGKPCALLCLGDLLL